MKPASKILFQSFVVPFYKENAATFVFIFTIMFFIVGDVDGAGIYEYHYSLVTGMLKSNIFLLLVFVLWFIYVRKFVLFASAVILNPQYSFLYVYNQLDRPKRLRLFFAIENWLLLPVSLYMLFIVFVGYKQQLYVPLTIAAIYLFILILLATTWHVYLLSDPQKVSLVLSKRIVGKLSPLSSYPGMLIRFIFTRQPVLFSGIKLFTCVVFYITARNNDATDNDITMAFLFYNFGLLANGVLLLRIRTFEETYLSFYRSLPVLRIKRLIQCVCVVFVLLIPELITTLALVPAHINLQLAVSFMACGFSVVLLMHSITYIHDFKMKDYIRILLLIFCMEYVFLITAGMLVLSILFLLLSCLIFLKRYYTFERIV
jgi:hypothetical protein